MNAFLEPILDAAQPEVFSELGSVARKKLAQKDLPSRKDEAWKFFTFKDFFSREFRAVPASAKETELPIIDECRGAVVVVRNGIVDMDATTLGDEGVVVKRYADLSEQERTLFHLQASAFEDDFFELINQSIRQETVTISVPKDYVAATPIQVLFVNDGDDVAIAPALHVVAGAGSKSTIVETSTGYGEYFATNHTTVVVGENARVDHFRVQRESESAMHIARVAVDVAQGAHYDSVSVTFGGKSSRTDMYVNHSGPNGYARIDGLAVLKDGQMSDTHSVVDNWHPHCNSHQLHKCVVDDKAHAIFNGKIFVQKDAQKVDAYQLNRNLLLSKKAKVNTKPQLEIFADDVRCTHGATIGQLDDEQLFYLMSRGTNYEDARAMLTYAFAAEVIDHISIDSLRAELESEALARTTKERS